MIDWSQSSINCDKFVASKGTERLCSGVKVNNVFLCWDKQTSMSCIIRCRTLLKIIITLVKRFTTEIVRSVDSVRRFRVTAPCAQYHQLINCAFSNNWCPLQKQDPDVSFLSIYNIYQWSCKFFIFQQFPKMNLFWTDEVHTPMNDTRSRDVTRKQRNR